ncbi:MAG: hypothetical protein JRG82_15890, partial [Deltaproteobacteria bacterium]|nr:hypothetical protein [Deltaproteobacteria bacterium]
MVRFALVAGLLLVAAVYYYFIGYGPTASEIYDDREWWQPRGWIHQIAMFSSLSDMARSREPRQWIPVLLFSLPALAGLGAGLRLFKGAVMRTVVVFLCSLIMAMVYYGTIRDGVWRFFEWRFILVMLSFLGTLVTMCYAPSLLRSLNRFPRAVTVVVLAAVFAGVFVLNTEVTGTNTDMRFNISPWPVVTVFGMLILGLGVAALHLGAGAALWVRGKMTPGAVGVLAGLGAALVVGGLGAFIPYAARASNVPGLGLITALGVGSVVYAGVALALTRPADLRSSGASRVAAALLITVMVGASNWAAVGYQKTARDETAKTVLVALEKYKRETGGYPEKLSMLTPDYLDEVPEPQIGLIADVDDIFEYSKYSQEDYSLEFSSVQ